MRANIAFACVPTVERAREARAGWKATCANLLGLVTRA